ncbi:hypothetical protein PENTCL1PPCAC_15551 [Pristionchus entomophagus]|uniref:Transthyretin-like family protein n=1 Tax=Pristionchus entomophagus TaxID=358040 RepID=A0AAV5TCT3_9BILA|nr:hypothetical protein PENTCL1PPCAC_15551 [Pristionchus entomophagus]
MLPSLLLIIVCVSSVAAATQSVGVQGQLMCGNAPLTDTDVTLWELHDLPEPDFQLATVKTDSSGRFSVSGSDSTTFTMKPAVRIYHRCNNDGTLGLPNLCQREVTYQIPSSYVFSGSAVNNWYQMGTMNMQAKQPNEQSHCASNPIRSVLGRR